MSRMPQKHSQNIISLCKCNTVYNLQQNGISRKTLISQIVKTGVSINYSNSHTATFYNTMLSLDNASNKQLLLLLNINYIQDISINLYLVESITQD